MHRRAAWPVALAGIAALGLALLTAPLQAAPIATTTLSPTAQEQATRAAKAKKPKKYCLGKRATIVGNRKSNRIFGTPGRDVIWAGRGADNIFSLGGKDRVCGGAGADGLIGGPGKDRLHGGKQRDLCWGERREHSKHYSCNVHLRVDGLPAKPPRPNREPAAVAATAVPAALAARATQAADRRSGGYFAAQEPLCVVDRPWSMVHLGEIYFQTYYQNPGWIAVRPYYRTYSSGGFVGQGTYQGSSYQNTEGWAVIQAPADGQVYRVALQPFQIYRDPNRIILGYEMYWWNGTSWGDYKNVYPLNTHAQTTTGNIPTGPLCMIGI